MPLRICRPLTFTTFVPTHARSFFNSGRRLRGPLSKSDSPRRQFPSSGFEILQNTEEIEEEKNDWYSLKAYYPVRIGETFRSRYQVLGKLGYGAHSTAWLGRDLRAHRYVTLKICEHGDPSAQREVAAYNHLDSLVTAHSGALLIRELIGSFPIESQHGQHLCLIHEALGMSVETFREMLPGDRLSEGVLKSVLKYLLLALDCLHVEGKMVHTDLQARNLHFRVEDSSILLDFEKDEMESPSARKVDGERTIYKARELRLPKKTGPPVLCDFGEARFGKPSYTDDIQPYVYRAPEVILNIPWSYEVDIWNVGVLIWDLFEDKHLFSARGSDGTQLSEYHLAEMVAILGPPPLEYLQRTETSWEYFNTDGTWKAAASIPEITLESAEKRLDGENKVQFLEFVRKMLQWCPERRQTAKQLLDDPWLNG